MRKHLYEQFLAVIRARHPRKSFGYILSDSEPTSVADFLLFDENIRNDREWKPEFESYGLYFVDHGDAGFVATPEESWRRQKEIWARGMFEIGVFHSHQRHPANFSRIDFDMHVQRFPDLWHMIVSMRNPEMPQVRVFAPCDGRVREVPLEVDDGGQGGWGGILEGSAKDEILEEAHEVLSLDDGGRPRCKDSAAVLETIAAVRATGDETAWQELVAGEFLAQARERYEEHLAPHMQPLPAARFLMGTDSRKAEHFVGETPLHPVELSPYTLSRFPVTNVLYSLLDESRLDVPSAERASPVVNVTWFDATLFALWMSCRLPTEAQWEFACGGGARSEWCCEEERDLHRYAWFCENAGDKLQPVASREPNQRGLFDLHGNVWEWCRDNWDEDYYRSSPRMDPVKANPRVETRPRSCRDRVTRGGSFLSLAEMCRTRYRFHEEPELAAFDLGFRLAGTGEGDDTREEW